MASVSIRSALPRALARGRDIRLGATVENVTDRGTHVELTWTDAEGTEHADPFHGAIITAPADDTLAIYPQLSGGAREHHAATEDILEHVLRMLHPYYGDLSATLEDHEIGRWRSCRSCAPGASARSTGSCARPTRPRGCSWPATSARSPASTPR